MFSPPSLCLSRCTCEPLSSNTSCFLRTGRVGRIPLCVPVSSRLTAGYGATPVYCPVPRYVSVASVHLLRLRIDRCRVRRLRRHHPPEPPLMTRLGCRVSMLASSECVSDVRVLDCRTRLVVEEPDPKVRRGRGVSGTVRGAETPRSLPAPRTPPRRTGRRAHRERSLRSKSPVVSTEKSSILTWSTICQKQPRQIVLGSSWTFLFFGLSVTSFVGCWFDHEPFRVV